MHRFIRFPGMPSRVTVREISGLQRGSGTCDRWHSTRNEYVRADKGGEVLCVGGHHHTLGAGAGVAGVATLEAFAFDFAFWAAL